MDYENKYKEALERAKQLSKELTVDDIVEQIFPELKESEDEKIRQFLIHEIEETSDEIMSYRNMNKKDVLDWLEKQGKQKPLYIRFGDIPSNETSKIYRGEVEVGNENGVSVYPAFEVNGDIVLGLTLPITKTTLYTQQHLLEYDNRPCYLVSGDYVGKGTDGEPLIRNISIIKKLDNYRIRDFEKQGEQTSDKVKLKFKVGDVVRSSNGTSLLIVGITDYCYNCVTCAANDEYSFGFGIQDEFDLVVKIEEGKWYICISQFCNCIEGRAYKATSDSRIMDDFGTEYDMHSDAYKYFRLWTIQDAKDGDVLSYRDGQWIFIYKEKIDDSSFYYHTLYSTIHQDLIIDNIGFTLLDNSIVPATKEQRDTLFTKMHETGYEWDAEKKELKKIEQKPVKVPKFKVGDKIRYLNNCGTIMTIEKIENGEYIFSNNMGHTTIEDGNKWYLVEQKTAEWSEEDEKRLGYAIKAVHNMYVGKHHSCVTDIYVKTANWLKSLKDRYAWKPSDEQMRVLDLAIRCGINKGTTEETTLVSLFNDLKKLKG